MCGIRLGIRVFPCSTEHGPIEAAGCRLSDRRDRLDFHALRSMAPLKPAPWVFILGTEELFPCSTEHGPIEARCRSGDRNDQLGFPCSTEHGPIEARRCGLRPCLGVARNFHALRSMAPLKPINPLRSPTRKPNFHALRSMAPLKQPALCASSFRRLRRFPCSTEHGPIEAGRNAAPQTQMETGFPCSTEHGPIEAFLFITIYHEQRFIFPCSTEHGPIEAVTTMSAGGGGGGFPCSTEHGPIEAV